MTLNAASIEEISSKLTLVYTRVDSLISRVDSLESQVASINSRLGMLDSKITVFAVTGLVVVFIIYQLQRNDMVEMKKEKEEMKIEQIERDLKIEEQMKRSSKDTNLKYFFTFLISVASLAMTVFHR